MDLDRCLQPDSGYLHDILEQPAALERTLCALQAPALVGRFQSELGGRSFPRIVLTGMGSSCHALHPLHQRLVARGMPAWVVETSELLYVQPELIVPGSLVVAVSQSGRSAETVRLLDTLAGREVAVVGVTNTAGSPLACGAHLSLCTCAGEEFSVSCKTYVAGLLALSWLGDVLCGQSPAGRYDGAAEALAGYLYNWRRHVTFLLDELAGVEDVFYTGRGSSLAAVYTGGLITKESTHVHAEGMSSAAFRHGPLEMVGGRSYVLVFAGQPPVAALNVQLAADITRMGGRGGVVSFGGGEGVFDLPPVAADLAPLLEILPVEMFTLALAALRQRTPGVFELGAKVTTTE